MTTRTTQTPADIIRLVKPIIDRNQPEEFRLIAKEAWFSKGLEAWIVSVDVDRDGVSGTKYAERLVDIEDEVQKATGQDIHVHPAMYRED